MLWRCWALTVLVSVVTAAQEWRVLLRDKGPEPFRPGSPLYERTYRLHSERALQRRAKVLPADSLLTLADAPLYEPYVESLRRLGAQIRLRLRWRNYVVVSADSLLADSIRRLPFVRAVQPIGQVPLPQAVPPSAPAVPEYLVAENGCGAFDYGAARWQLEMLAIPELHRRGWTGEGVLLGLLDTGFRWRGRAPFARLRVLAEWDALQDDSITAVAPGEPEAQDFHGTAVLSLLAAVAPGKLIGAAPGATYVLAKTEDIARESHFEEDAYAAALEWMEALGVDVVSSSLGYREFDPAEVSYSAEQLDGRTTIVAQAVREAVRRGVICVTAMGNSGARGLVSPADAATIAVAAVDSNGRRAAFSSVGRRGAELRPTLAAPGVSVVALGTAAEQPIRISGTSAATPLVAGVVALLLGARPELAPEQLCSALLQTASQGMAPDTLLGYGIPDALGALRALGGAVGPPAVVPTAAGMLQVGAFVLVPDPWLRVWVEYAEDTLGSVAVAELRPYGREGLFVGELPSELRERSFLLRVRARTPGAELSGRWYAVQSLPHIPCGMELPPSVPPPDAAPLLRLLGNPIARGEECWLWLRGKGAPHGWRIRIWDVHGRCWEELTLPEATLVRLPTQRLAAGVYWIEALALGSGLERSGVPLVIK
jgi:serine protease AprX